jgi:excisionase family DNA binding protein
MLNGDQGSPALSNDHALLTIDQAARRLGVTPLTVRRQIKAGKVEARRVRGKFGPEWRVMIAPDEHGSTEQPNADDQASTQQLSAEEWSSSAQPWADDDRSTSALIAMVADLHGQIRKLEHERFEMAGRLGYFQSELEHARQTIKALEAPKEPIAPPPPVGPVFSPLPAEPEPPRRPWWKLW